jgi:hypothetical protein
MPFNTRISFGTIFQSLPLYSFQSLILTRAALLFSLLILLSLNLSININNFVLNALILHNIPIRPFRAGALSLLFDLSRCQKHIWTLRGQHPSPESPLMIIILPISNFLVAHSLHRVISRPVKLRLLNELLLPGYTRQCLILTPHF